MGLIIAVIVGGLAGWVASILMKRDAEQGVLLNVVVGIVGAFLGNLLLAPVLGESADITRLSLTSFIVATLGAVILLALVNLFTRSRLR